MSCSMKRGVSREGGTSTVFDAFASLLAYLEIGGTVVSASLSLDTSDSHGSESSKVISPRTALQPVEESAKGYNLRGTAPDR